MAANLDVDTAIAEIQQEESEIQTIVNSVTSRSSRAANLATIGAAVAGGGIGIVGTAMQFSNSTAYAGDGVTIASGAVSTVLSLIGVKLQASGTGRLEITRRMLAPLFGRTQAEATGYPESVWRFLDSAPNSGGETRIRQLVAHWTSEGVIPNVNSPRREAHLDRASAIVPRGSRGRLPLSELSNRAIMLSDLRTQVALMKIDLAGLMRQVRAGK